MRCIEKTTWFLALWSKNCRCRCIHASLCSFTSSASVNPEPDGTRACPATRQSATLLCWTCPKEAVGHTAVIYHNSRVCVEGGGVGWGGGCLCVSSPLSLSPLLLIVEEKHSGMFVATVLLLKFLVMVSVHYFLIGFLFPVYLGYFMCVCVCLPLIGGVSMGQAERKLVDVIRSMYFLPWSSKMMKGNKLLEPFFLFLNLCCVDILSKVIK